MSDCYNGSCGRCESCVYCQESRREDLRKEEESRKHDEFVKKAIKHYKHYKDYLELKNAFSTTPKVKLTLVKR